MARPRLPDSEKLTPTQRRDVHRYMNPIWSSFYSSRQNAKNRGYKHELSKTEYEMLALSPCHYCGLPPNPRVGVDRVDNTKGYEHGNVVSCCFLCNQWKRAMTVKCFVEHARRIAVMTGGSE